MEQVRKFNYGGVHLVTKELIHKCVCVLLLCMYA